MNTHDHHSLKFVPRQSVELRGDDTTYWVAGWSESLFGNVDYTICALGKGGFYTVCSARAAELKAAPKPRRRVQAIIG